MAAEKVCKVEGCGNRLYARGWCAKHYERARIHGSPDTVLNPKGQALQWINDHVGYEGSDCLVWPFFRDQQGYGMIVVRGKTFKAARYMCLMVHGAPGAGMDAAHSCGNGHKGCVNPRHVRWATKLENAADRIAHGRAGKKLTADDVRKIKQRLMAGEEQKAIAADFGVSPSNVCSINRGATWSGV